MSMTEKQLIINLIKDDLTNHRLVMGLHALGLITETYGLQASETIFNYMDIPSERAYEANYARYETLKDEILEYNLVHEPRKVDEIAGKIYKELLSMKNIHKQS